jgi:hypothetical protein
MVSEGLHLQHHQSDVQHGGNELCVSCMLNYSMHTSAASTSSATAGSGNKPPVTGTRQGPGPVNLSPELSLTGTRFLDPCRFSFKELNNTVVTDEQQRARCPSL